MHATGLKCRSCAHEIALELAYSCPRCAGILEVTYDYDILRKSRVFDDADRLSAGLWRFAPLLPVRRSESIVSLGEGNTPLLPAPRLGKELGISGLYLKNEAGNPTGSFKDRPTSVGVSVAKEFGARRVIVASSGNAGAAVAAYAARAGLGCVVVVPDGTPSGKVAQTISCGATVVFTRGSYSSSYKLALDSATRFGWANLTSTFVNPFTVEGDKTVAYEIWEQLGRRIPDWVVIPIGAGPLLVGALKGFEELTLLGLTDRVPAMIGVQSEAVRPVADAFAGGRGSVREWHGATRTVSSGIADPLVGYPQDGTLTLKEIRRTGGRCVAASDAAAIAMGRMLAESEGVFVEPTASTGICAIDGLHTAGIIGEADTVVAVLTGHGLKTADAYTMSAPQPPVVASPDALRAVVEGS